MCSTTGFHDGNFTLGSLFDGAGTFPLAASMCGGEPAWAAEVEPYPIAVTHSRFPDMLHLGDVSQINGGEIPPVNVITFGSPCQDLSIAGKRKGMQHSSMGDAETTRSGLLVEAVRIIKEMREATHGIYPRIAVWENVVGAFSCRGGKDFCAVLQALIKTAVPEAPALTIPTGGWPAAGRILGDGFSLCWRVLNARFWGVPQQRRRVFVVADFAGDGAEKILFERAGLRRYFAEGKSPWEIYPRTDDTGIDAAVYDARGNGNGVIAPTLIGEHSNRVSSYTAVVIRKEGNDYTARRLTPTECARLQGFPDYWGTPDEIPEFAPDEVKFWQGVRDTLARLRGYKQKKYTPEQLLKWYRKLRSDTAEYRMWGNAIALPCALYVMQGIQDVYR